jgi:hypothetical protein
MRKITVFVFVILTVLSLGLTLVPHVYSQPENIKVLSYSWYIDSLGFFVAVGEIQNVGSSTIDTVVLSGSVYTKDGTDQSDSFPAQAYVKYLLPQQKAPFYMEFPTTSDSGGNLDWLSLGVDRVDFKVETAEATTSYQYPDLTVKDSSGAADAEGVYWVRGTIQNTGTQAANNIRVIGTFYNSTGSAVAVGYTNPLTPATLTASGTASFKVGAFDLNQTVVPPILKIYSYSLLIQADGPILSGTPPPVTTSTGSTNSTSPSNPTDSPTPWSIYAIVAVVVILGFAGTILLLRRRKPEPIRKSKSQVRRKQK